MDHFHPLFTRQTRTADAALDSMFREQSPAHSFVREISDAQRIASAKCE
jgi:hypothetical protein